jgi:F0F1-type ATP synthase delta subunit
MLLQPRIIAKELIKCAEKGGDHSGLVRALVDYLTTYQARHLVVDIEKALIKYQSAAEAHSLIRITLARESDASQETLQQIVRKYDESLNTNFNVQIDKDIIGGYICKSGGKVYNYSVEYSLQQLSQALLN